MLKTLSNFAVWLNTSPASPAPLSTSPAGDVCKYYIGPSVACLSVLSSPATAVAVATQRRADRRRRVYDCPTAARSTSRQVSGHVFLLDAQSACPSTDRWYHSHAIEVTCRCYIINGRWCWQWRRWGRWCIYPELCKRSSWSIDGMKSELERRVRISHIGVNIACDL